MADKVILQPIQAKPAYGTQPSTQRAVPTKPKPPPVQPPVGLPLPLDNPRAWAPTINGITVKRCFYDVSGIKTGTRVDKKPVPGLHYPNVDDKGYDLVSFKLTLEAYNDKEAAEMQSIYQSVFPAISDTTGSKSTTLTQTPVVMVEFLSIDQLGVNKFKCVVLEPPAPVDGGQYLRCVMEFLQWTTQVATGGGASPGAWYARDNPTGTNVDPNNGQRVDPGSMVPPGKK